MAKIRVLVVDDSVVARRLLSDAINAEAGCEVVGLAANGKLALAKIPQVNPDIVTLDVEMPEMDGLQALAEIRKIYPRLPVVMFSTLNERGAESTLKALELGATDYITKPSATTGVTAADQIRERLIPIILALGSGRSPGAPVDRSRPAQGGSSQPSGPALAVRPSRVMAATSAPPRGRTTQRAINVVAVPRSNRIDVVAIGVSTGGPNVLATVIPALPGDLPVPVVITQHMPPLFTRLLADRLGATSKVKVREAAGGDLIEPGNVYIAPGDYHMEVRKDGRAVRVYLHQGPPENSCRPAVDVMFRSVVEVFGGRTLGVILTGMGQDGLRGCELVCDAGGYVVVQDEASSVVWGMPGTVARAGLADSVVSADSVAAEISRRVGMFSRGAPARAAAMSR